MKLTTSGKSNKYDWFGLNFTTKVPMSWIVVVETLGWEVWKVTVTTPNGISKSSILKKTGDKPAASVEKHLFHRNGWTLRTGDVSVEDFEEEK